MGKLSINYYAKLYRLVIAGMLSSILIWAGVGWHSTAKIEAAPTTRPIALPDEVTSLQAVSLTTSSVFTPLVTIIPGHDGAELFISIGGTGELGGLVFANLDIGPTHKKGGYALVYSNTLQSYQGTAAGFAPGLDEEGTLSVTTTLGLDSGIIQFQRAYVQITQTELINVDSGAFIVDIPNLDTLPTNAYLGLISTHAAPGPPPLGYSQAGNAYSMRSSGALTQSDKFMTLKLKYQEPLPNGADPHTLTVARYRLNDQSWQLLGGDLFNDTNHLTLPARDFGIYALLAGSPWRDSFKEFSLSGISALSNTEWGPGDAIILSSGATGGTATSTLITPTAGAIRWGTLRFSADIPPNTGLSVDVLDGAGNLVLANVGDGDSLTGLSLSDYPGLKLRATLTSAVVGQTPRLEEWSVAWLVHTVYLPVVVK